MTKSTRIHEDMSTRQILLFVQQLLKQIEIVVRSRRGKTYKLEHTYAFARLKERTNKAVNYYMAEHGLLSHVRRQTDLFLDKEKDEVFQNDHMNNVFDTCFL